MSLLPVELLINTLPRHVAFSNELYTKKSSVNKKILFTFAIKTDTSR